MEDQAVTNLLRQQPYQCLLCNTSLITGAKNVREHVRGKRHQSACERFGLGLHCTNPQGGTCLSGYLMIYFFPEMSTHVTPSFSNVPIRPLLIPPEFIPNSDVDLNDARRNSFMPQRLLNALTDQMEAMIKLLNVTELAPLLEQHGFPRSSWGHLSDNKSRVQALCAHIMSTNHFQLCRALTDHCQQMSRDFNELYSSLSNALSDDKASEVQQIKAVQQFTPTPVVVEPPVKADTDLVLATLQARMLEMSQELHHYRQAAETGIETDSKQQSRDDVAVLVREQTVALKNELSIMQSKWQRHLEHYAGLMLPSSEGSRYSGDRPSWVTLLPSPEGTYPLVEWQKLTDSKVNVSRVWKQIVKSADPKDGPSTLQRRGSERQYSEPQLVPQQMMFRMHSLRPTDPAPEPVNAASFQQQQAPTANTPKLSLPLVRLAPSLFPVVGAPGTVNMWLSRLGDNLYLSGTFAEARGLVLDMHVETHLSLPLLVSHSASRWRTLHRDNTKATLNTSSVGGSKLMKWKDIPWGAVDPDTLPRLSVSLRPVASDATWWWHGMAPVSPVQLLDTHLLCTYPEINWGNVGGDVDWIMAWQDMLDAPSPDLRDNNAALCLPPLRLLPSNGVMVGYLVRSGEEYLGLFIAYHEHMISAAPLLSLNMQLELRMALKHDPAQVRCLRKEQIVHILPGPDFAGVMEFTVKDWNELNPDVPPVAKIVVSQPN